MKTAIIIIAVCEVIRTIQITLDIIFGIQARKQTLASINKVGDSVADDFTADKWIPVSERLPVYDFGCLVTVEEDDICGEPQSVIFTEFVGYDGETWRNADREPIPFEVIAWMPLPKPYEPQESEE